MDTLGFQVITTATSREAMNRIAEEVVRPSLIMAGYRLPGENTGAQAIQHIWESIRKEIPAMLITGDTSREVLNIALAGDFQILQKPVDCENLITCIGQLLTGTGAGR